MNTKMYSVRQGEVLSIYSALIYDIENQGIVEKGDSNYKISLTTLDSTDVRRDYVFSLDEFEGSFERSSDELKKITLRDTSVHKKIEFTDDIAILYFARGRDVVGANSEVKDAVTKEIIINVNINGVVYEAPYDMKNVYEELTGRVIEPAGIEEALARGELDWENFLRDADNA